MAITLNLPYLGLLIPNAYIRIDQVTGGKREGGPVPDSPKLAIWRGTAGVYASKEQDQPILQAFVIVPFISDQSPFPALYEALKLLPEFAGSVDC